MTPINKEEAVRRDDKWLLSTVFKIKYPYDLKPFFQCFCNVLPERPLITEIQEAEHLLNTRGKKVQTYYLKTATGPFRAVKMAEGMVLAPFDDVDISTTQGRSAFLRTARVCVPLEWEHSVEHAGYAEYAGAVGTLMLREMSKPKPIYLHARFTYPSMGLNEPEGYCFLFRLEDQSEFFLMISDSGAILTVPEPPFEIIASKSKEDTERALADFRARNPGKISI
ncbi:hypothetical protein [Rhizobium leguminosarum]